MCYIYISRQNAPSEPDTHIYNGHPSGTSAPPSGPHLRAVITKAEGLEAAITEAVVVVDGGPGAGE